MIAIAVLGTGASRVLRANTRGEVLAVFRRSFYLHFGDDVVCFGPTTMGCGPLNALCAIAAPFTWPEVGLAPNDPASLAGSVVRVVDRFDLDFGGAQVWHSPVASAIAPATLKAGVVQLAAASKPRSPGGLGALLVALPGPFVDVAHDALLDAALPPIIAVRRWLRLAIAGSSATPPSMASLIGLGPGLTPSGDDFLCGLMAALHYLGHAAVAQRLAQCVLPIAGRDTSLISAAYLRCASSGEAAGVLFDVLDSVAAGGDWRLANRLDAVNAVGHTSGWDSLAGAATVCAEVSAIGAADSPR